MSGAVEGVALAERLRAAITYQYMPMSVRKLLSEAAQALTTPPERSYADEDVARIIDTMLLNADDTAPSEDYRQGVRDTVETYRIAAAIRLLSQGGKV